MCCARDCHACCKTSESCSRQRTAGSAVGRSQSGSEEQNTQTLVAETVPRQSVTTRNVTGAGLDLPGPHGGHRSSQIQQLVWPT
ncbi:hypothetical protein HETIRDRAFT_441188 [Heterobasidion irregulare TC 32-1]|uniref:Uncharacterized protein n=1 Tax=Heterobasidion irregulare (strain TC 32-1) TaxID=747525 RepID=W4JZX5_HETIT|nr:uncharacterized protein HETIRDRAFT_441188 [Heterobasidion irregulare TC 32-1]ETW79097.1 hypothetical protein HETIRDRAFT_441188 [Heterobasidion irregulare TC 32-1]